MKKVLLLLLLLLATGISSAQVVIPDANFKAKLIALGVDTSTDGNIQFAEAAAVTTLNISSSGISNITGIEAFTNLVTLNADSNTIVSLAPLNGLASLYSVSFTTNTLGAVAFTNLPSLHDANFALSNITSFTSAGLPNLDNITFLSCPLLTSVAMANMPVLNNLDVALSPNLVALSATNCPQMIFLSLSSTLVQSIDLTGCSSFNDPGNIFFNLNNLQSLNLTNCSSFQILNINAPTTNDLSSLNVTGCTALGEIYLPLCSFSSLDLTGAPNLYRLELGNNNISTLNLTGLNNLAFLDIRSNPLASLDLSEMHNLQELKCSNTAFSYLNIKNGSTETLLDLSNNLALTYVCADENQVGAVQALVSPSTVVGSYCDFVPGGNYNTITGTVRFDGNGNGCDASDTNYPVYVRMNVSDTMSGNTSSAFVNSLGNYTFYAGIGNYTIAPGFANPLYFNFTPVVAFADFPLLDNSVAVNDFCVSANGVHPDLSVVLSGTGARPGLNSNYQIVYKNNGNTMLSDTVTIVFDDARMNFVSATPAVSSQALNTLAWNFSNLAPFESRSINLVLSINGPTATPPVNAGDELLFTASISLPPGEETPADNTFAFEQTVVNSFDPNNKICLEGESLSTTMIGKYLHYNINFENTGTANAINIVVKDVIDTTKFDISTLQIEFASHPVRAKISGNLVEFTFEGINLPPAISNPIGGHGNVLFKIKTLPNLPVGTQVTNSASIFFDYNFPIVTEEARSTFNPLKRQEFNTDQSVVVFPNPVKNYVHASAKNNIQNVAIFDVQGRILQNLFADKNQISIDLTDKQKGIYLLKITTVDGVKMEKIIKE